MYESACEPNGKCDTDQLSFKAYLARWMAATTKVAPFTSDFIMPKIRGSAQAAAAQCTGAPDGNTCGTKWTENGQWDGTFGVGQQMSALEVIQSTLITNTSGPVTNSTGGTSKGDPAAGSISTSPLGLPTSKITKADQFGAAVLTALSIVGFTVGIWWIIN